ncbi:hypothetical protein BDZ45DRAFT_748694 [Acephala macrosclerotiorum]|nr:hypothetical protein BDZ45DRAFT_748694 [Acephala macrosclerotiorum]
MASFENNDPTYCKLCNISFPSFIDFHRHKLKSSKHPFVCEICSQDFNTQEAMKQHHDLMHSDEQNLQCPGCNKKFNRLGGLIGHLELKSCRALPKIDIEAARKELSQQNSAVRSARNFNDFSRSGASPYTPEPLPLSFAKIPSAPIQGQLVQLAAATPKERSFRGDDLIDSLDIVAANMDTLWGDEARKRERNLIDFPALGSKAPPNIMDAPMFSPPSVHGLASNAWGTQQDSLSTSCTPISLVHTPAVKTAGYASDLRLNFDPAASTTVSQTRNPVVSLRVVNAWVTQENSLASASPAIAGPIQLIRDPAAPPAPTPLTSVLAVLHQNQIATQPDAEPNPYDPDNPDFKASKYWIPMLAKYKCPYFGCGKGIKNPSAFIQHLKSPAHRNENLQCTKCLRYYATATALTQHMESQGVRCKVRLDGDYSGVVDEVTGGVALAKGRLMDKTVKYVVNEGILDPAGGVVATNKAAVAGKNSDFNNVWDTHEKRW